MIINQKNRERLLDIAEAAILNYLDGNTDMQIDPEIMESEVTVKAGAFVSVYVGDKLRGCIGTFSEAEALFFNVHKMALSAAFNDSRFEPVNISETGNIGIEISVLTPRQRIFSEDEIEIGKHGIYMIADGQRGTLLPQVAVNNKWTSREFLEHCAQYKTGLHNSGWRDAELYTYEAIVFSRSSAN